MNGESGEEKDGLR